jgi:hypothetical protein
VSYLAGRSGFGDEEEQRQDVHFISEIHFFGSALSVLVQDVRDGGEPLDPPEMETTRPSPVSRSVRVSSFTGEAQPFFFPRFNGKCPSFLNFDEINFPPG